MKKYLLTILIISISILVVTSGCSIKREKELTDEEKFEQEYEMLNGKTNDSDVEYKTIDIPTKNKVEYINAKEAIEILEGKTGVIYFGFPECPWCRNALPVLMDAVKETGIDKIYYYNALNIRDTKHLDDDGKVVVDKKGTKSYKRILELLGDKADVYDGLEDESIKRLYFPTVVFVREGKVISLHSSTVESQTDPSKKLTKKQTKELKEIYVQGLNEVKAKICEEEGKC